MAGAGGEQRREVVLTLTVNGSRLTGTMTADGETAEMLDGSVVGDTLTVTVSGRLKDTGQTLTIGEGSFQRRR